MKKAHILHLMTTLLLGLVSVSLWAQNGAFGAYSPYSVYGIGDISPQTSAHQRTMGGVGIASRDKHFLNTLNPAAISARDSLAFMFDISVANDNVFFRQGDKSSLNNSFNITNISLSFPIYRSLTMALGIFPECNVGYDFSSYEKDWHITGETGNINYSSSGIGSVNTVFATLGVTFWKRLSLGGQFNYSFGNFSKTSAVSYEKSNYRSIVSGHEAVPSGIGGKVGLQYEQPLGEYTLGLGATYRIGSRLSGEFTDYRSAVISNITDSVSYTSRAVNAKEGVKMGDEWGVGLSLRYADKWSLEVDYTRADWRKANFESFDVFSVTTYEGGKSFSSTVSQAIRAGFSFVPNRNDIRYYHRRVTYRLGAYYGNTYYQFDGQNITYDGISLGVTLPVFRWYNGLTLGIDFGRKGSVKNNMVRETYVKFNIGFNLHDIWFQKPQYN